MKDYFGREAVLRGKKLWLLDMDGTIYMENQIFDTYVSYDNQSCKNLL